MADDEDKPPRLIVQQMCLLDCGPARADTPDTGEKIVVITLEHKGEVETPFMLDMRDAHSLARRLLKAMAFFEDEKAYQIIEKFWPDELEDE